MTSRDLLRSGDPRAALESLKQEVRRAPRDPRLRTFLFQLFCVLGEWERALTQLTAAAELDPAAEPMAHAYRALVRCEVLRERIFAGTRAPTILGQPEPWMPLLLEALRLLGAGEPEHAARLRDEAFEQAPATPCAINGTPCAWIADADPRLGPMLEAIVEGRYVWVAFHNLAALSVQAPADLRDQVWMPAIFTWANGGESVGFIPARYPGSATAADPALALGRRTEWADDALWPLGLGQRMFATDRDEVALMDLRALTMQPSIDTAAAA